MIRSIVRALIILAAVFAFASPTYAKAFEPKEVGEIVLKSNRYGSYHQYVPWSAQPPKDLVVVVHGSVDREGSAINASRIFIERWTGAAEKHQAIILAPAFDQKNFGGHAGPGGGYRGLWGRHIGADGFVDRIVSTYTAVYPQLNGRFRLYGHSAGGQFVSRYVVRHPHRIRSAVICAAGTFAFPNSEVKWTNGMATLTRRMRWSNDEPWKQIRVEPDSAGWRAAAALPIAVVVGARDTKPSKTISGHPDGGHVTRARAWVRAMRTLAQENGFSPGVRIHVVPGVGHNSQELTTASIRTLFQRSVDGDL